MVKKLLKHEFIYYLRTLGIMLPIVLAIGIMTRVVRFFESDDFIYDIMIVSSGMMLYIASFACLIVTWIISIVRFYKNMYTSEGYLTFTLPVTNSQHIFVKLLTATVCQLASLFVIAVSVLIALTGKPLAELMETFSYLCEAIATHIPTVHTVLYCIELIIMLTIYMVSAPLLYYACITVGQTAKKNRILMAVGVYFVYYMVTQVLSTVFMIVFTVLGELGAFEAIGQLATQHPYAFIHGALCLGIVFQAAIATLFYFITHSIMSKKLNLE